jgi:hypothetical protein
MKKIITVLFLFFSITAIAQKDAGIKKLLDSKSEFIIPQTVQKITAAVKVKPSIKKGEVLGTEYEWTTPAVVITTYTDNNNVTDIFLSPKNDTAIVSGLPYNLIFNKTEVTDCEKKFTGYSLYHKGYVDIGNGKTEYKLVYQKSDLYFYFIFNQKGLLKSISVTHFDLDAVN